MVKQNSAAYVLFNPLGKTRQELGRNLAQTYCNLEGYCNICATCKAFVGGKPVTIAQRIVCAPMLQCSNPTGEHQLRKYIA